MTEFTPRVLFLSAPIGPPWTRRDKNLVRLIASNLSRYQARVLTHEGVVGVRDNVDTRAVWGPQAAGQPSLVRSLAVFNRVLSDTDANVVHLLWPADLAVASLVRTACSIRGLPVLHTLVHVPQTTVGIRYTTAGGTVVCQSRAAFERVRREEDVNAIHIPPGVVVRDPIPASRHAAIRESYGLPQGLPLCIYAGDYAHSNAARTVAATLPRVLRETECHFVMACRVQSQADREEQARIKEAVAADGNGHRISFVGEVKNLRELLSIASVQLFPVDSRFEKMSMPLVLLEGLGAGLATVVADKPPLDELIDAGAAIGVPPMQPVALAVAIVELLRDEERREELGRRGRELVQDRFEAARVVAEYEKLYDRALGIEGANAA